MNDKSPIQKLGSTIKRRVRLVHPRFQLSFVAYFTGVCLFAILTLWMAMESFFDVYITQAEQMGINQDHILSLFVEEQQRVVRRLFGVSCIAIVIVMAVSGLIMSHRVAGPLHRLQIELARMSRLEPFRPIHFRKFDYFPELADAYNAAIKALKKTDGPPPPKA